MVKYIYETLKSIFKILLTNSLQSWNCNDTNRLDYYGKYIAATEKDNKIGVFKGGESKKLQGIY
jgi:hypothetical protein